MNEHTRQSRAISVTVEEAEARIAELLRRAEAGERIEVTRDGRPVAELTAAERRAAGKLPRVGAYEGQFILPDNWDEIPTGFEKYR